MSREHEREGASLPLLRLDSKLALVAIQDAPCGRQPQTMSGELCGEEGVEDLRQCCDVHSLTIVANRDIDNICRVISMLDACIPVIHRRGAPDARDDFDSTFGVVDCVGCVRDQVH